MGTISIVIPVLNQLHYTKGCLESLWKTVPADVKIIVINNGSTDGTADYLAKLNNVETIQNDTNRGCAAAWNQGVKAFQVDWTVVLNNDVVLSSGWLENLIRFAEENNVGVATPGIREGELNYDVEDYAREFTAKMKNVVRNGANGICFAVRRDVFNKVGLFDENFRIGVFEDADFFLRTKQAGFRLATTGRSFIHHFGSITQKAIQKSNPRPYEAENRAYFRQKWKLTGPKRFTQRWTNKIHHASARLRERLCYGHSLNEKWIDGELRFF